MRHFITGGLLVASALLAACGDSDGNDRTTGPAADLNAGDIVVDLDRDVRDNLAAHFSTMAAKRPDRVAAIRYDFSETSRSVVGTEGIVTGDFTFFAEGDAVRSGSLAIFYRAGERTWFRTGLFEVSDRATADLHDVTITVRDAATRQPVVGASVEAVRIDNRRVIARVFTDAEGKATMQILPGVFQVGVSRDDYSEKTTDNLTTVGAADDVEVLLVRSKDPFRSL